MERQLDRAGQTFAGQDRGGPYGLSAQNYAEDVAARLHRLHGLPIHDKFNLLFCALESGVEADPHVLLLHSRTSMRLLDDTAAVHHLEALQRMAGVGVDPLADERLRRIQKELQQMMKTDVSCSDDLGHTKTSPEDPGAEFMTKWKPFPEFTVPVSTPRCQQLLDRVRDQWSTLQENLGVEQLVIAKAR